MRRSGGVVLAEQVVQGFLNLLEGELAGGVGHDQLSLLRSEVGSPQQQPPRDGRGQVDLVFLDLPKVFPVLGAVGQEIHLWSPLQVKEELLEGAGHLEAVVVLEGFVQLLDYILETIILRSGRVDHVFDLAPGRTAEAGQKVDGGLLLFVVDAHLQVVQHDALAILLVGGRLAIEEGNEVVPGDIGGTRPIGL